MRSNSPDQRGGGLTATPFFKAIALLVVCTVAFSSLAAAESAHGFNGLSDPGRYDNSQLTWREGNMTWCESYPEPGSERCIEYNGCFWKGQFAYFGDEKKSLGWVANTHILSVHGKDFEQYKGKVLRLRKDGRQVDAMVYDLCSDDDCEGCCSENCRKTGFLIAAEIYTLRKFGVEQGVVERTCLDCD